MSQSGSERRQPPLPIVIVGHVDHGKSTLVGRLLHDTGSLPEGKVDELKAQSDRRGTTFEWSFVMDAFQVERDQGITLDTTRIWFKTAARDYVIIDAPGHKQFLKNMVTGAANADAAILVIDAAEGLSEQTRRHAYLLHLLGIAEVVVVVNKMDLVGYDRDRFNAVAEDARHYLERIGITSRVILPVSAREGDNLAHRSQTMPWWAGPVLVEALDAVQARPAADDRALRLPIQDVYREGEKRIFVGRIESGRLRVGDIVEFSPGGRRAGVASIEGWNTPTVLSAGAGQSVAFTLDDDVFVERGQVASHPEHLPREARQLQVRLFWLDRTPLREGDRLNLRLSTASHPVTVEAVRSVIDVESLERREAETVQVNEVAEIQLRSPTPIWFDRAADSPITGRAVLARDYRLVGGCIVTGEHSVAAARANITPVAQSVTRDEVATANGHMGGVLWLTGLSGAGKSTLAMGLRRRLFERGRQVFVIDGDNLRHGLNSDLGFTPEDRAENIRRAAEVARLFADSGAIAIVALISPTRADRDHARRIVGDGFQEIFVRASLEICEGRDPKGLYAKARAGKIPEFTGISAPYEEPDAPDLTVDTEATARDKAVDALFEFVERRFALGRTAGRTVR